MVFAVASRWIMWKNYQLEIFRLWIKLAIPWRIRWVNTNIIPTTSLPVPFRGKILFFPWHWFWFWNFLFFGKTLIVITNLIEGFLWLLELFPGGGSTLKLPWDWVVLKLPLRLFDNFKPDKPCLFAVPSPTWGKILDFLPFFEFNRRRVPRSQQLSWAKSQACFN